MKLGHGCTPAYLLISALHTTIASTAEQAGHAERVQLRNPLHGDPRRLFFSHGHSPHGHSPSAGGGGNERCENTCICFLLPCASDGECDDGGPGSEFNWCGTGNDCSDCGPRSTSGTHSHAPHRHTPHTHDPVRPSPPPSPPPPPRPPPLPPSLPPPPPPPSPAPPPPYPDGVPVENVVSFALTIAGEIHQFDPQRQDAYITGLANTLNVDRSRISLAYEVGSVHVRARIAANSAAEASSMQSTLQAMSPSTLSSVVGVTVEEILESPNVEILRQPMPPEAPPSAPPQSPPPPSPGAPSSDDSFISSQMLTFIAIGAGTLVLMVVVWFCVVGCPWHQSYEHKAAAAVSAPAQPVLNATVTTTKSRGGGRAKTNPNPQGIELKRGYTAGTFCTTCGANVTSKKFCDRCGTSNAAEADSSPTSKEQKFAFVAV